MSRAEKLEVFAFMELQRLHIKLPYTYLIYTQKLNSRFLCWPKSALGLSCSRPNSENWHRDRLNRDNAVAIIITLPKSYMQYTGKILLSN